MSLTSYLRHVVVSCGLVLLVASCVAGAKLLPFIENYGGSLQSIGPLAAAALATVFEVAVILGTPVGFALAASRGVAWYRRNSANGSINVIHLLRGALVFGTLWAVSTLVLGGFANVELAAPGRVVNGLLGNAREACSSGQGTKIVTIPILGNRFRCNAQGPPTLMGELSRANATVSYSATNMSVSEDMTYVLFRDLTLASPAVPGRPALRVSVEGAKLRGFWSFARPVKLGEWGRASFVSVNALWLSLLAVTVVGHCRAKRVTAGVVGSIIACSAWFVLLFLDGRGVIGFGRYALVPLVGGLITGVLLVVLRSEPKWRERLPVYRKQLDSSST